MARSSGGKFLEILDSEPALDVPIEVDVFDGANPATMLATLDGASSKRFTREINELGSGSFTISRKDPKATAANLAIGNLVKFRVAGTHRHAIWIEEPATTVVSGREEGGEDVKIAGRGALAYLERATVYPPVWPAAAASIVGQTSVDNGATGAGSITVVKPGGAAAGDVVLVAIVCLADAPSMPVGWKLIRDTNNGTFRVALYRKRILDGEPASWRWSWASTDAVMASAAAIALRNASSDDTTWAISDRTGSGTEVGGGDYGITLPSVSVGLVDGLLLGIAAAAADAAITPDAGLTELIDHSETGRSLEVAALVGPLLGPTGDLTATLGAETDWIGLQVFVPSTASSDALFAGATFGGVLATLLTEAQGRGAVPALTFDFTAEVDSHGEPWPDVHDLSFHVGTSVLDVWRHLVTLGLEGGMTPELRLQAFVDASRHFESSVIMRKGQHLAGDVVDTAHGSGLRTRLLIEGAGGRIIEVADPPAEVDGKIGRREGFLSMSTSDNPTTLQRAGEMTLAATAAEDRARAIAVEHGTADEGHYEPWVDYREGDWIGLDADGTGGDPTAERVASITLAETEAGDFSTELELNSVELDAFLRIQRRLDALSRQTAATGSGGAGSMASAVTGRVASVSTDAPGYLFDKLTTDSTLAKSLVGAIGSQRVELSVAPGGTHPDLAAHDALGLATDAELAAHVVAADPHPGYETTAEGAARITAHEGASDPHAGYQRESEKGAANGYASLGATARVPMAQLASGTPDGTKYVRDDGTLATPFTNPMTTVDDVIIGGTAGAAARLGKGADGQVLTVDPTTHHVLWMTPTGGSGITVEDEGTPLATAATTLDFVGGGVVASGTGTTKTITISGASVSEITDIPTAETDVDLVLKPDGAGGVAWGTAPGGTDLSSVIGVGASVTIVGTGSDGGASPISIAAPGSIAAGDLILFAIATTNSVPNAAGPTGTGWTELLRFDTSSSEFHAVYSKIADGTETTFEITHSAGTEVAGAAVVIRGVDTLHSSGYNGDSFASPTLIGHPEGLHVLIFLAQNTGNVGAPAGDAYTADVYFNNGGTYASQVRIVHRLSHASFDAPSVTASGAPTSYGGAFGAVFYAA